MIRVSKNQEKVKICAKTDIGIKHRQNEDHFLIVNDRNGHYDIDSLGMLFAVADGMSGHKGGAKASHLACEGLLDYYTERATSINQKNIAGSRLKILEDIFYQVHLKIHNHSLKDKVYERMGTTLSALVYLDHKALIAHVGDSRIYRFRNNTLEKLTQDHTMAELSVEMGYIKPEDVENNPQRHVLMNVIGQGLDEVQTRMEKVETGDLFLLCTDGLHHVLKDDTIREILEDFSQEEGVCDILIREAIEQGSTDNITVIAVHFVPG